jgi:hypothetical protein
MLAALVALRSAVLMVSGHARYLMALLYAMVFTQIAHSAMLVKSNVVSLKNLEILPALLALNAVILGSGSVLLLTAPTVVVVLSHQESAKHALNPR